VLLLLLEGYCSAVARRSIVAVVVRRPIAVAAAVAGRSIAFAVAAARRSIVAAVAVARSSVAAALAGRAIVAAVVVRMSIAVATATATATATAGRPIAAAWRSIGMSAASGGSAWWSAAWRYVADLGCFCWLLSCCCCSEVFCCC
jgi:hypothetical protein